MAQIIITQGWHLVANIVATIHAVVTRRHVIITRSIGIGSITVQ